MQRFARIFTIGLFTLILFLTTQLTPHIVAQTNPSTLTPTPDPFAGLSIAELAARTYGGGSVTVAQLMTRTSTFTRYLISYPSDGLTIYGFMDVPRAAPRQGNT